MQDVTNQLRGFLQYVALQFVEHPEEAQLRVAQVDPEHLSFRLVLAQGDVAQLIGRNGFTAGAIRTVLEAAAERAGIKVTLRIHSTEEEHQRMAALEQREIIEE